MNLNDKIVGINGGSKGFGKSLANPFSEEIVTANLKLENPNPTL